ncbi:MAG: cobyrinate a,c-diamide synthase [Actinomycetota bacterium]|nr:cobyrinate a,c-diamide synthase [Actinomycetota bacterium]
MVARLVVAAPSSGQGKTTVATGLMAALRRSGLRVSGHKVGPDYIDPGYHALATGRPGRNLDPWLVGEERVAPLLAHGAAGADVAVVEGVMGLFDGAAGAGHFASTAHVARLLDAPVLLVVDASRMSRSVAALVHGFAAFDPEVRVAGVILNRVGSPRHEQMLREALSGVPVLGAIRRHDDIATPSRHLGLVPAAERSQEAVEAVEAMARIVAGSVDLEGAVRIARTAAALRAAPWQPWSPWASRRAVFFGGRSFTFGYAEHAEMLAAGGAEVCTVDPLREEALPPGADLVVLGGGFPEMYAAELSANESLRRSISTYDGRLLAECAGLLYLCRDLDGLPMAGVLDAGATMTDHLTLGYRDAVAAVDSVVGEAGTRVRGHEFHRTSVTPSFGASPAWRWEGGDAGVEGHVARDGRVHASYLHTHWAGLPVPT